MDHNPSELTDTPEIKLPGAAARIAKAHPNCGKHIRGSANWSARPVRWENGNGV